MGLTRDYGLDLDCLASAYTVDGVEWGNICNDYICYRDLYVLLTIVVFDTLVLQCLSSADAQVLDSHSLML